ncbi:MAG: helix-turn-helix domain-containing protein [Cetobacterium sp.]
MERDFKGVWVTREIWLDKNLSWMEKLLLVEIDSLAVLEKGCFATNEYFANFFDLSKDRVSKLVSSLKNKGYIELRMVYKAGTKQIEKRVITTRGYRQKQLEGIGEINYTPIGENAEDNNTSFNNTINITTTKAPKPKVIKKTEVKKEKISSSLEIYLKEKGYDTKTINNITKVSKDLNRVKEVVEEAENKNNGTGWIVEALKNNWVIVKPKKPVKKELSGRRSTATLTEKDLYESLGAEEQELKNLELKVYMKISTNKKLVSEFHKVKSLEELKEFVDKNNLEL